MSSLHPLHEIFNSKKALSLYVQLKRECNNDILVRQCLFNHCENKAINSHILQKRRFLTEISHKNHVLTIKLNNPFEMRTRGALKIDKTGINEALALPLFCKEHDNYVFEYIETCEEIVEDYMTALLFSYRSLCAEIRKKIYNHFFTLRLYNYEPLQEYLDERAKDYLFRCSEIDETAILNDLDPIKDYLEGEILKLYTGKEFGYGLNIHYQRYNRIDVCVSTLMSYFINNDQSTFDIPGCLFINILPFKDYTLKITCIHDLFSNNEVETEFDIWNNLNQDEFNKKVTMTILKNAETWAMSPTFYYRLPIEKKKMIIDEWNKTIDPRIESGKFEANLFDINGIT